MDESGGSGQPRSGTDEATERHGEQRTSSAPAAGATRSGPERPEHPTGPTPPTAAPGTSEAAPSPDRPHDPTDSARGAATHSDPSSGAEDGAEVPGASPDQAEAPAGSGSRDEAGPSAQDAPHGPSDGAHPHPEPEHPRTLAHSGTGTGTGKAQPPRRGREPGGGLLMGRPFGVPVYVAPSWFLVAALITWVFGGQLDRVLPELGALRYLVSLFFAVAFYASVLVHELAHTVAALRFKLPVRRIQLQFFGGVSEIEKEAETPGREFVLSFVGPLLSLVLSGLFYLAMLAVEPGTVPGVLLAGLMISNLIVAAFNLLPGLPLDGGRMLRAVVWKITGRPMSGTIAAAWVGRALAVSVLIGLPLLTQSGALGATQDHVGGMDTVTDALLAAILAAIIWTGAGNSLRMARLREHLPELRARSLTRRAVPVETSTPLSEALRRANEAGARALVVVDADGEPLSLVREAAIVGVPEHRRPWVAVSGLAQDLTDGMRVSAELAGEALLDTLRATPATEYLVVEDSGEIYGVLSAADVERAFVKAMARPS
ncbi:MULTISPECIES: site-2 protease family protein [unclassified Streptomyces]|uniref:site-2 protease family protein n=1 Tax=unclassified Streptomyces TaxID=2593676 RepID=UPI001164278D|nr:MULTISPECIES: site-2 protease family protein [unclassified Streptomyces]NMI57168.1 peptidase [Streptomyces sp. RLA2-12]QDN56538.1 peptidase [Streptomyces sp. S1D4-20]QDN66715.1 peptidase [Streptomyces sp. S1D4-14]QDO49122.1 peptidase [Streptomyces sp. RLB3-5]QDO59363.1 peptidase [Streptomyces sp. RLB1-8]